MSIYELAIVVANEADLPSGHRRKKEGDIVAIRPYPWNWGLKEIDAYLIVIIETSEDLLSFDLGSLWQDKSTKEIIDNQEFALRTYPQGLNEHPENYVQYAKTRYKIDLAQLKILHGDLDLTKVCNKTVIYQPMKSKAQIISRLDGKEKRKFVDPIFVQTTMGTVGEDAEVIIQGIALIEDKLVGAKSIGK